MKRVCYATIRTPWVLLLAASSERGLLALHFVAAGGIQGGLRRLEATYPQTAFSESVEANRRVGEELTAYAAGDLRPFTVPLDLRGTPFQLSVWKALLDIPYGETRTYAEIARATGHPHAFRAVGAANHSNPIAIIVPCHRVIASDGGLCGYGGGLQLKKALLDHERRYRAPGSPAGLATLPLFEQS